MSKRGKLFKSNASSSIVEESVNYAFENCIPLFTTIEITLSCNLKCLHCYNYDRAFNIPDHLKKKALSTEEIHSVIEQVCHEGALYLNFTGGEALTHPHLVDFVKKVRKLNGIPRLKTNGTLLTKNLSKQLAEAGLDSLDLSLYGASELTYQKFTQTQDAFTKVLRGIENVQEAGIDVTLNIILHKENVDEIKEMVAIANQYNIAFNFSDEITERYDDTKGSKLSEMGKEQFEKLLKGPFGEYFMRFNDEKALQCSCARTVCGITSTGEVYPCIGAPIPSGNLRDKSFKEIWTQSVELNKIRNLKREDFSECSSCEHVEFCNRSSGSIFINTGNYTGCDTHTLELAEVRHKNKDLFKP